MAELKPITQTCTPRADVLAGGMSDDYFAAQLDRLVRTPAAYPVYGDPTQFFDLTYPTAGLRDLLTRTFGRLSAAKVPGAEHGLIRSETSFGGGKTHSLMAVYHLASGARPLAVAEFVDPALLPSECQLAGVVADTLDPINGLLTNGRRSFTLWGEIGAQLGAKAFEALRLSDAERTAPSKNVLGEAIGDRPTVIIIDEIAAHLRQLTSSGNEEVRRMASAIPVFFKNLLELTAVSPRLVVLLTLATHRDAFGKETDELTEAIVAAEADARKTMEEVGSVVARFTQGGSIVKPAEDNEIAGILKRRLFSAIDPQAAAVASEAYQAFYEDLAAKGEQLTGGADHAATYAQLIQTSYPFHPELIRVLDKRLSTIPRFNRARGALKLLAEVIAGVWATPSAATEIINVADLDYQRPQVLRHLTIGLERSDFENVAKADFVGDDSHAAAVDQSRFAGRRPYTRRACHTVFTHSLEMVTSAGARRSEVVLGTLAVGDSPDLISEALGALDQTAWFLDYSGMRWRFSTEPNANNIVAEAATNVPNSKVNDELRIRIAETFPSDGPIMAVHFPAGAAAVPDMPPKLRLVVMHHDDLTVRAPGAAKPPTRIVDLYDHAGAGEGRRKNRNAIVFLVADADAVDGMRDRVRFDLAAKVVVNDGERMRGFTPEVQKKLRTIGDTARLNARVALTRCYRHLYIPAADKANDYLRHEELASKAQGDIDKAQTKVIVEQLREFGKVRTQPMSTDYLRSKAWPKDAVEVTTEAVADAFWQDHGAQMILDITLLRDTLRDGVRNGAWVYWDAPAQRAWTDKDPAVQIQIGSDFVLYTPTHAAALGLLGRPLTWEDIAAVMDQPQLSAAVARAKLETRVGKEPAKSEVLEVLARAAEGGENARVVAVVGPVEVGAKGLTPSEIRKAGLDNLTVLAPSEADRLSVTRPGSRRTAKPVEASGAIGVAFQSILDQASDTAGATGFTLIQISASAAPGEGVRHLVELNRAVPMLPKNEIDVVCDIALDFTGLTPGVELKLAGPAKQFQRVEDALFALARKASDVAGTLRIEIRFESPVAPDGKEMQSLRNVLTKLNPGEVRMKGILG
jgi:hypothetical protein